MKNAVAVRDAVYAERGRLWALCYRMSGCAADADDLVQDTFERALSNPPADLDRPIGPWLTRVAMNLARDHLRARRRQRYEGPWLPGPAQVSASALSTHASPETRYGELESVTVGFLTALEALTPAQRAVLILRDVVGHSVEEAAQLLDLSEPNVKTTHHRARRAMTAYDHARADLSEAQLSRHRTALQALLGHLATRNVDALTALLCDDVRAQNDADGKYFAARRVVHGVDKVVRFHLRIDALHRRRSAGLPRFAIVDLNGEPTMIGTWPSTDPKVPERMVVRIELDPWGRIQGIDTVVSDRKLRGLDFGALPRLPSVRAAATLARATLSYPPPSQWAGRAGARLLDRLSVAKFVRARLPRR